MIKPIFKWMGGKRNLMCLYEDVVNIDKLKIKHFYDLFGGSLASSIWAYKNFPNAIIHINEKNPFLIGLYECIGLFTEDFIASYYKYVDEFLSIPVEKHLDKKGFRNQRKRYFWYREHLVKLNTLYHKSLSTLPVEFYALQYLLQRISYGGAWQTNKELSPTYATPSGSLTATGKSLYNAEDLRSFAKFVGDDRVEFTCLDYALVNFNNSHSDTLIFADPPYVNTEHKYGFKFTEGSQRDLCSKLIKASKSGCKVMFTNSPWDQWEKIFKDTSFKMWYRDHKYTVGQGDVVTKEVLISNILKPL